MFSCWCVSICKFLNIVSVYERSGGSGHVEKRGAESHENCDKKRFISHRHYLSRLVVQLHVPFHSFIYTFFYFLKSREKLLFSLLLPGPRIIFVSLAVSIQVLNIIPSFLISLYSSRKFNHKVVCPKIV